MTERKTFHIGDLVSVTTGCLVSPDHMDGVYRVVDFMTGIPHFTHQLGRGAEACKPYLLEQHPWLAEVTVPASVNSEETARAFLDTVSARHGERHEVKRMPFGAYVGRDPLAELEEKGR